MVKKEKHRKLHGSVLLTVVCVMSLLIVFLFGTLTLATAANNRAHVNYSSAQTDVTSKIAVDAAIKAIAANDTYGNIIANIDDTYVNGKTLNVPVAFGTDVPNAGRYGSIVDNNVKVEWAGTKSFYNPADNNWITGGVLKFSATASMGGVDSTTTAYVVKNPAGGGGGGGAGAGFVTTAGAKLPAQTSLYGGSYIDLPAESAIRHLNYDYRETDAEYANWSYEIDPGDNPFAGGHDYSLYRQFAPLDMSNPENTSFYLKNTGGTGEADLYVNNNMYVMNWSSFVFPSEGKGITVWGDYTIANYHEKMFRSSITSPSSFNKTPYFYVDGGIILTKPGHMKDIEVSGGGKLNIFCGYIDTGVSAGDPKIDGSVYCMNPYKKSTIGNDTTDSKDTLRNWIDSTVNRTAVAGSVVDGNVCSKGDLRLANTIINGDVRVDRGKTLEIRGDVVVKGDVIVDGAIKSVNNNAQLRVNGTVYCDVGSSTIIGKDGPLNVEVDTENYVRVPTVENTPGVEKLYYYVLNSGDYTEVIDHGSWQETKKLDFDNNPLYDGESVRYEWKTHPSPEDYDKTITNPEDVKSKLLLVDMGEEVVNEWEKYRWNSNPGGTGYKQRVPRDIKNGSIDYYWVEAGTTNKITDASLINITRMAVASNGTAFDTMENFVAGHPTLGYNVNSPYMLYRDGSLVKMGSDIKSASGTYLDVHDISTYGSVVYPEEAERDVIIGRATIPGKDKSSTQVVKTLKEILDTSANPYKFKGAPSGFEDLSTFVRLDSTSKLVERAGGKYAYKVGDFSASPNGYTLAANNNGNKKDYGYIVKDQNCIINIDNIANGDVGWLVFDPGAAGRTMNVAIEKLSLSSGVNIFINDYNKKSEVNIYVVDNSEFHIGGSEYVITSTYRQFLDTCGSSIGYNSPGQGTPVENAGRPCLNIYGGSNSVFSLQNEPSCMTANIISPDLYVDIRGGASTALIDHFYYNGLDLVAESISNGNGNIKGILFGCLNAGSVFNENIHYVCYVTDADTTTPPPVKGNGYDYRVLYYDEY